MNRFLAAVLAGTVLLQIWALQRQGELRDMLRNVQGQQVALNSRLQNEVSNLQSRLNEMADADRWMAVQEETVTPAAACDTAQARVQWELQQWAPGTTSRLLYRTSAQQTWQEAKVEPMGGQNYAAVFTVPVKPMLEVHTSFYRETGANSVTGSSSSTAPKPDLDGQYQIVAEGPQFNRSSGVQRMPIAGKLVIPVVIQGRESKGNNYEITVRPANGEQNSCTQISDVTVRAYAGDRLVETRTLQPRTQEYTDAWKSAERLTRLEVRLRHGGGEEEVRLDL